MKARILGQAALIIVRTLSVTVLLVCILGLLLRFLSGGEDLGISQRRIGLGVWGIAALVAFYDSYRYAKRKSGHSRVHEEE